MMKARTALNIFVLSAGLGLLLTPTSCCVEAAVKTSPVSKTNLADINTDMVDSPVEVEAQIKSITPPHEGSKAPFRIELKDATGLIILVIWPDLYETVKSQSPLSIGDVIHVSAKVTMYRDNLQLQVREASDLKIVTKAEAEKPATQPAPPPTAPPTPAAETTSTTPPASPAPPPASGTTPVGSLTPALIGKDVTVQAAITEIREPREGSKAPYIVTLTQDNAHVPLVYWSDMHPQLKDKMKVGNQIRVNGQVTEYRGTLQLKIRSATDVTVLTAP